MGSIKHINVAVDGDVLEAFGKLCRLEGSSVTRKVREFLKDYCDSRDSKLDSLEKLVEGESESNKR